MKQQVLNITAACLVFVCTALHVHAQQVPDPMPYPIPESSCTIDPNEADVAVPAAVFPIGGLHFWANDCSEIAGFKSDGLNTMYHDYHGYKFGDPHSSTVTDLYKEDRPLQSRVFSSKGMKSIVLFDNLCAVYPSDLYPAYSLKSTDGNYVFNTSYLSRTDGYPELQRSHPAEYWALSHQILAGRDGKDEARERHFFLSSNFGVLNQSFDENAKTKDRFAFDLKHPDNYNLIANWNYRIGQPDPAQSSQNEWIIPANLVLGNDATHVLSHLDIGDNGFGTYYDPNAIWIDFVNQALVHKYQHVYCDFVYRIDQSEWNQRTQQGIGPSDQLYTVEYYQIYLDEKIVRRHHLTELDKPITFSQCTTYVAQHPKSSYRENDQDIFFFPDGRFQSEPSIQPRAAVGFANVRTIIPLATTFDSNNSVSYSIVGYDCALRANNNVVPIRVRGLRVRSDLAEDILSGQKDPYLKTLFQNEQQALLQHDNGLSGSERVTAWDNVLYLAAPQEQTIATYPTLAYVSQVCLKTIGKPLTTFFANNLDAYARPEWYRACSEEMWHSPPSMIGAEDVQMFGNSTNASPNDALPVPADALDYELRSRSSFKATNHSQFYLTTLSQIATNDMSAVRLDQQVPNYSYADYTSAIQERMDNTQIPRTNVCYANATVPPWSLGNYTEDGKFFSMLNSACSFEDHIWKKRVMTDAIICDGPPTHEQERVTLPDKIFNTMRSTLGLANQNVTHSEPSNGLLGKNFDVRIRYEEWLTDPNKFASSDGENPVNMKWRPTFVPEIRAQAWYGLCYGSKGLIFNVTQSDFVGNIGWTHLPFSPIGTTPPGFAPASYNDVSKIDYWPPIQSTDLTYKTFGESFRLFSKICSVEGKVRDGGTDEHPLYKVWPDIPLLTSSESVSGSNQTKSRRWTDQVVSTTADRPAGGPNVTIIRTIPLYTSTGTPIDENATDANHENVDDYCQSNLNTGLSAFGYSNFGKWKFEKAFDALGIEHPIATRAEFFLYKNTGTVTENLNVSGNQIDFEGNVEIPNVGRKPFYWIQYHYPRNPDFDSPPTVNTYFPTYYGFKEKDKGAKQVMGDVTPIAATLSRLHWVSGVNYSHLFDANAADNGEQWNKFGKFPILKDPVSKTAALQSFMMEPNKDHTTPVLPWTLKQSGTVTDDPTNSLYELGLFVDPNQDQGVYSTGGVNASEYYMIVLNKRTWPVYYTSDVPKKVALTDPTSNGKWTYEGAIDCRRISFRIDPTRFRNGTDYPFYLVTDVKTGAETVIEIGKQVGGEYVDNYNIDLEPGEGRLIKIEPLYSFKAGSTTADGMEFNNGHRIAEVPPTVVPANPPLRIMTWVSTTNGTIQYSILNNPPQTGMENYANPADAVANGQFMSMVGINPSVAVSGDKVGIIYNHSDATRDVVLAWGSIKRHNTSPYSYYVDWQSPLILDTAPPDPDQPDQLVTPVIAPAIGHSGNGGFFCAWSKADGNCTACGTFHHYIQPAYVDILPGATAVTPHKFTPIQAEGNGSADPAWMSIFPTVATRDESAVGDNLERLHLGWEERWHTTYYNVNSTPGKQWKSAFSKGQIYYKLIKSFTNVPIGNPGDFNETFPIERVTKNAPACENHHPNIAVQNIVSDPDLQRLHGEPVVTWELTELTPSKDPDHTDNNPGDPVPLNLRGPTWVIYRDRGWLNNGPGWGGFTQLYPSTVNLPLPLIASVTQRFPSWHQPAPFLGQPKYGIVYQDTFKSEVHLDRDILNGTWLSTKLTESGRTPSLLREPTQALFPKFNTFTFRGVDKDEDGLFSSRVTAPLIPSEKTLSNVVVQQFMANQVPGTCEQHLSYQIGPGKNPASVLTAPPDTGYIFIWPHRGVIEYSDTGFYGGGGQTDTANLEKWPRTEDSIRTNDHHIAIGDSVILGRILKITDSSFFSGGFFLDSSQFLTYELDLKDSASHELVQVIDRISLRRMPDGNVRVLGKNNVPLQFESDFLGQMYSYNSADPVALSVPPSGSGYLTLKIQKDDLTQLEMTQSQLIVDPNFDFRVLTNMDTLSFKKSSPTSSASISIPVITVYPNPFRTQAAVEVEVEKGLQTNIAVYDALGRQLCTLFNDVSGSSHYSFNVDGHLLNPGSYYVRVQAGNGVMTQKVQLIK